MREPKPLVEWNDLYASIDFRLLWRFQRLQATVVANAHAVGDAVEIWIQAITERGPETLLKETFTDSEELEPYLRGLKEKFVAAGWEIVETQNLAI